MARQVRLLSPVKERDVMENLSWLILMEASFQQWAKACTIFAKLPKPSRLHFFNMLYGPHLGEH